MGLRMSHNNSQFFFIKTKLFIKFCLHDIVFTGNAGGGGAPIMGRRMSRNNSQSSSLLNNRLSLAEAAGPDALPPRHVRNGSSVGMSGQPPQPHSASGTLKRGTLSRQQSQRDNAPQVRYQFFKGLFINCVI